MILSGQHRKRFTSSLARMMTVLAVLSLSLPCEGFSPIASIHHRTERSVLVQDPNSQYVLSRPPFHHYRKRYNLQHATRKVDSHLFQSKDGGKQVDGTTRGLILFSLVLAVCVWLFSIPTEFRRAHFCMVEKCVQNRAKCYDCVTFSEWKDGVTQYYRNGGGIQFDFTVAEETKAVWNGGISK